MKLKPNELVIKGKCINYTHDGKGIVNYEAKPIYVDGLILNETAEIVIDKIYPKYGFGTIKKIITPSLGRVDPSCPYYQECGGCQLQHLSYEAQLDLKQHRVQQLLKKEVNIKIPLEPIIGMKDPNYYRNKIQVPVNVFKNKLVSGYYALGTHKIIDMKACLIDNPLSDEIVDSIKKTIRQLKIDLYDQNTKQSLLRHIVVRNGYHTKEIMIVLITSTPRFPKIKELISKLLELHKEITTIIHQVKLNVDNRDIYGEKEYILYGKGYIEDTIGDLRFQINSRSFYQINTAQTEILYGKAIDLAKLTKEDNILDAYCGVGTIGLLAARHVKSVTGVEIIDEAIENAKQNAKLNNIDNANFYSLDAGEFIQEQVSRGVKYNVVFVDPPRLGLSKNFIQALLTMKPKKIVYISCDPSSLARDLIFLLKKYNIELIQPIDMFPQTFHVENIVLLESKR